MSDTRRESFPASRARFAAISRSLQRVMRCTVKAFTLDRATEKDQRCSERLLVR